MFVFWKSVHPIHFQRTIVFVQSRRNFYVMPLMLSYRFRVLDAVALFVLVVFQHIVVAVSANISAHIRLADTVGGFSLLIMSILILSKGTGRASYCECEYCQSHALHVASK